MAGDPLGIGCPYRAFGPMAIARAKKAMFGKNSYIHIKLP